MKRVALAICLACSVARADILFFVDNPNRDQKFEHSWGYSKNPSSLELEAQKFPVTSERAFNGRDSLRLRWTSASNGEWGVCVAVAGWLWVDTTNGTMIRYRANAPEAIPREALPSIALEDSANHKSDKLWIGNYCDGIDGDSKTWQDIEIPLSDIKPGPMKCDMGRIKSIYHFQHHPDAVERMMWIDDLRIVEPGAPPGSPPAEPAGVVAAGRQGRIDVRWSPNVEPDIIGYNIYRGATTVAEFLPQNVAIHEPAVYSDDVGGDGVTYFYRVTAVNKEFQESKPSKPVSATSAAMTEKDLITYAQQAAFHYFYEYAHPVSGLARERKGSSDICAIGASGFGLLSIMVGAERGFITRDAAAAHVRKVIRFLEEAPRHHGAFPHWIHGVTGETVPFSEWDDGGDLVETAYLVQGLLACRQYFDKDNEAERHIRDGVTRIWESVEWNWYRKNEMSTRLYRHWSPNYDWRMDTELYGFSEAHLVYILAIASPTHPIPASMYYEGWASDKGYANGKSYYGRILAVGPEMGGPLFFTHLSYAGFDPRKKHDRFCNYFENNRNMVLINQAYCADNPGKFRGYSERAWGLSSSDNPYGGFAVHQPKKNDNGTLAPAAMLASMPYAPKEVILSLRHLYKTQGARLWGEFGFRSGFNPGEDWYSRHYIGIDLGPVAPMIENTRSGLCWKHFMANPEIGKALKEIGFIAEP
jgi:hypothetical protein